MNLRYRVLEKEIKQAKNYLIIVEGKKDKAALTQLGFENIFVINESGKSLYEKIEQITELAEKTKVCILTDFDKKGKQLYLIIKSELSKSGVKLDSKLRNALLKEQISHIEGLSSFMENIVKNEQIKEKKFKK